MVHTREVAAATPVPSLPYPTQAEAAAEDKAKEAGVARAASEEAEAEAEAARTARESKAQEGRGGQGTRI